MIKTNSTTLKIKYTGYRLLTQVFNKLDDESRVLVSSNSILEFKNTSGTVDMIFDNMNIVPEAYKQHLEPTGIFKFPEDSEELKSAKRRFIKGTSINIKKITFRLSDGAEFLFGDTDFNSLLLDSLTQESLYTIKKMASEGRLAEVYYTNNDVKISLDKINIKSRRWVYEN